MTPAAMDPGAPPAAAPTRRAVFIGARRYRGASYGDHHPLAIPRVSLTLDLIRSYDALRAAEYLESRCATEAELLGFHTPDYIAAMRRCEALGKVPNAYRQRHNIGNYENPYFPGFFHTPATAAGGSVQGAEQLIAGRIAFNPAGGMHHARADQARGFCFFNDPVLAIQRLRREGMRVLYVDIDAHHGDGVEAAFHGDAGVATLSLHMDTAYAYPFTGGGIRDWGGGRAVNLPLPRSTNDSEYRRAFETLWRAALESFRPDAVTLQAGTDILFPDPLGKFRISTALFLELVETLVLDAPAHPDGTPRLLALGGGGYHPLALARCWTGVWAVLSGRRLPEALPAAGAALLREVDWDLDEDAEYYDTLFTHRVDAPRNGPVRREVVAALDTLLAEHPLFHDRRRR
ncbi:MAG: acetoin utilization protein AcuC [Chromatiales bacterium 21-64-14]|nr:MAG: acetoin utilization protein AcuC [Chromatiales bacterium 21-64-14]HQU16932.1 acetoin utilization protein AcuC [Gammaproteobacteria bacterium]